MNESEMIKKAMPVCLEPINDKYRPVIKKALEEVQQYREIGTVEEIKEHLAELERWHTDTINQKIKNVFANTSTLICHNCDHKDEYIEELEAEIEEYRTIGTVEECRDAVRSWIGTNKMN